MGREFDPICLELAATAENVSTLGPGNRMAIWFQGCKFTCPGCVAPSFQMRGFGQSVEVDALIQQYAKNSTHDGLTVSGGEPFDQAMALADLLLKVKERHGASTIVYSGYTLAQLKALAKTNVSVKSALGVIDVLIDGLYEHAGNDSRGLRGSSNQNVHFLTRRYRHLAWQFEHAPRSIEVVAQPDGDMMIGLPPLKEWQSTHVDAPESFYTTSPHLKKISLRFLKNGV